MSAVFRTVAYAAWVLAFGLSVWLAVEFHEYKFGIALGVAILALILSAFGLVMARFCGKDRVAMVIGVVLWAAGAVSFAITELGFWSSSYKERHAQYVQVKEAKTRQEGLKDLAWEALRTGETRATTAELEARIKAARQHDRWASSNGCANATVKESREFCQGYYELEARLAAAGKLEALESRLLGEKQPTAESMVHNVFAAADLIAEISTLSEKEAATLVVLIIAVVLMLSRDLLLIVANPFGGATGARAAAKPSEATETPAKSLPPVQRPRTDALTKIAGVSAAEALSTKKIADGRKDIGQTEPIAAEMSDKSAPTLHNSVDGTDFDGPGTPANLPKISDSSTDDEDTDPTNVVPLRSEHPTKADLRIEKAPRASENSVSRWLRDCTGPAHRNSKGQPAHKLIGSYLSYCRQRNETPLSKRKFSTVLRGELDLPKLRGADGKRKSAVMLFPLELVNHSAKRRVA